MAAAPGSDRVEGDRTWSGLGQRGRANRPVPPWRRMSNLAKREDGPARIWSAVAERSGDTAFNGAREPEASQARTGYPPHPPRAISECPRPPRQSGVAAWRPSRRTPYMLLGARGVNGLNVRHGMLVNLRHRMLGHDGTPAVRSRVELASRQAQPWQRGPTSTLRAPRQCSFARRD